MTRSKGLRKTLATEAVVWVVVPPCDWDLLHPEDSHSLRGAGSDKNMSVVKADAQQE